MRNCLCIVGNGDACSLVTTQLPCGNGINDDIAMCIVGSGDARSVVTTQLPCGNGMNDIDNVHINPSITRRTRSCEIVCALLVTVMHVVW